MRYLLLCVTVFFVASACNPPHVDQSKLEKEKFNHGIVKVSKGEIMAEAAMISEQILSQNPIANKALLDSLSANNIAEVKFINEAMLQTDAVSQEEMIYFESYKVAVAEGNTPTSVPEYADNEKIIQYTSAVVDSNTLSGVYFVKINAPEMIKRMKTKL